MKNKNVSNFQKLVAYLVICLTISSFIILRSHKNTTIKQTQLEYTISVETAITQALNYLYNSDLNPDDANLILHKDYKDTLISKFSKPNALMKKSNLNLSNIKIYKDKIYHKKKKKIKYIIYEGKVELSWNNSKTNTTTDPSLKNIIAHLICEDNYYKVTNITLSNLNESTN